VQDAAVNSDAVSQDHETLSRDEAPTQLVPCTKRRTKEDEARVTRLLGYQRDNQTLEYLTKHHKEWMADPYLFLDNVKLSHKAFSESQTRAISEHFDTERDNV